MASMGPKSFPPFFVIATAAVTAGLRCPPLIPIVTARVRERASENIVSSVHDIDCYVARGGACFGVGGGGGADHSMLQRRGPAQSQATLTAGSLCMSLP